MKVNLGCGTDTRKGYLNVDIAPKNPKVKKMDLNKKWTFKNNSVNYVIAHNIYEHVDDAVHFWKELHRICKPKAVIQFTTSSMLNVCAWGDPEHKRAVSITLLTYHLPQYGFQCVQHNYGKVNYILDRLGLFKQIEATIICIK